MKGTRHNAGFLALDAIAAKAPRGDENGSSLRGWWESARLGGKKALLLKPSTFMNLSGQSVREAMQFYKLPPEKVLVIFDDINLEPGRLRIRRKGSDGGHNGMKNIIYLSGSDQFPRIKLGVGKKPHPDYNLADWVLSRFTEQEQKELDTALENAAAAAELIVTGRRGQGHEPVQQLRGFPPLAERRRNAGMKLIYKRVEPLARLRPLGGARWPAGRFPAAVTGLSGIHKCCVIASLCQKTGRRALVLAADEAEAQRFWRGPARPWGCGPSPIPCGTSASGTRRGPPMSMSGCGWRCSPSWRTAPATAWWPVWTPPCNTPWALRSLQRPPLPVGAQGLSWRLRTCYPPWCSAATPGRTRLRDRGSSAAGAALWTSTPPAPTPRCGWSSGGTKSTPSPISTLESQRRTDPVDQVTLAPCVEAIAEKPLALAAKIEKLAASLRGKNAPKAKEILRGEAEKLKNGLRIGSLDKYISLLYPETATLLDYFPAEGSLLFFSEGNKLKERMRTTLWQWGEDLKSYLGGGRAVQGLGHLQRGLGVCPGQGPGGSHPVFGLVRPGQL